MPPQQSHGLLDVFDERFGFGAHDVFDSGKGPVASGSAYIVDQRYDANRCPTTLGRRRDARQRAVASVVVALLSLGPAAGGVLRQNPPRTAVS